MRVARPLEQVLGGAQHAGDVAVAPRVGEREARRLRPGRDELLDLGGADLVARRPRRELVDLRRELVEVVADQLDQQPARLGVARGAAQLELLADPAARGHGSARRRAAPRRGPATALAIGASFFSSPATSASVVPGSGAARYSPTAFASARLPRLHPGDDHEPACPSRTARGRCRRRRRRRRRSRRRRAARPRRPRSGHAGGATARSTFGRSVPAIRYAGFSSSATGAKHRRRRRGRRRPPRPRPGRSPARTGTAPTARAHHAT